MRYLVSLSLKGPFCRDLGYAAKKKEGKYKRQVHKAVMKTVSFLHINSSTRRTAKREGSEGRRENGFLFETRDSSITWGREAEKLFCFYHWHNRISRFLKGERERNEGLKHALGNMWLKWVFDWQLAALPCVLLFTCTPQALLCHHNHFLRLTKIPKSSWWKQNFITSITSR